ncbi:MAG: hypothetical protein FWE40_08820, partial [Oscillospiraceae bacterium]|nr:hypothetical protein [Oscillospiraceae bacterium]
MKKKNLEKFDEREQLIRKQVINRGFCVLVGLLAVDHVLKAIPVYWALGSWNNMVYVALAATVILIEFIVRGVYFGWHDTPKTRLVLMLILTAVMGLNLFLNVRLFEFAEHGQLTMDGATFIALVLFMLVCVGGTVRAAYDLRRSKQA